MYNPIISVFRSVVNKQGVSSSHDDCSSSSNNNNNQNDNSPCEYRAEYKTQAHILLRYKRNVHCHSDHSTCDNK